MPCLPPPSIGLSVTHPNIPGSSPHGLMMRQYFNLPYQSSSCLSSSKCRQSKARRYSPCFFYGGRAWMWIRLCSTPTYKYCDAGYILPFPPPPVLGHAPPKSVLMARPRGPTPRCHVTAAHPALPPAAPSPPRCRRVFSSSFPPSAVGVRVQRRLEAFDCRVIEQAVPAHQPVRHVHALATAWSHLVRVDTWQRGSSTGSRRAVGSKWTSASGGGVWRLERGSGEA